MKKKIALLVLTVVFVFSFATFAVAEEKKFSDLNESHWAYLQIQQLVDEGIVNGYDDGTFRPEDTVTRGEFAKLYGKGSKIKPKDFVDLPRIHWAYSYIMTSGMDIEQDRFYPDREMTRGEALKALYDRYATKDKYYAPAVITDQYSNKEAAAWAYSKKLMIGDDGINLRLDDTITRAEAVALILRARNVQNEETASFIELADDSAIEKYYNCIPAFSSVKYSKDVILSNGEFADIAVKIIGYDIEDNNQYKPSYDGKYASQIAYMTSLIWGKENNNAQFEKAPLTFKNAITGYVFAASMKANGMLSLSGKNEIYSDVVPNNDIEKSFLMYAYENGIFLTKDATLNPDRKITLKELVCLYMQMDNAVGFEESFNGKYKNESSDINVNLYPSNYQQYSVILESVPNEVYEQATLEDAKSDTPLVKEYKDVFEDLLVQVNSKIKSASLGAKATYYPTLVSMDNSNVKMVIKIDVTENNSNIKYSDIFKNVKTEDNTIETGTFYLIISTNSPLTYGFEFESLSLDKII